ncbi:MAG: DinB family protein [Acidimicrobiales bacterium]
MPIVPDTKDWTWVIEQRCAECGFDASAVARDELGTLVRENAAVWVKVLDGPGPLRERPSDDRWSALEYACHVRDVFLLYDERTRLMLDQTDPQFASRDQDAAAVEGRYNEQDPAAVGEELVAAAGAMAATLDGVGDRWDRTGRRDDGARFTIDSLARYMIHDPVHHVDDVANGYAALGERGG